MGRTEKILDRIDELYNAYVKTLLNCSQRELIDKAEDIAFIKQITDLLHDEAEELPDAFVYNMQCSDTALYELLGKWQTTASNRREDERDVMRELVLNRNSELASVYRFEEMDDELEM